MIKYIRRILYLGYYVRQTNWAQFRHFLNYVSYNYKITRWKIILDVFSSSIKYNISLLEYFLFHFWEQTNKERANWAGTGFMYEYQLIMNPPAQRDILLNKAKFLHHNAKFISHRWFYCKLNDKVQFKNFLRGINGKVVLKSIDGNCGKQVQIVDTRKLDLDEIISLAKKNKLNLAEEYIYQHDELMQLSPAALNTVRIVTQLVNNEVIILGARLRISVDKHIDNLAAGNLVAAINPENGIVDTPAVYSDITKAPVLDHPVTGKPIIGFKVPFWPEIIQKVKEIAIHNKNNKSVGWDIAVTSSGIDFIEGNHDWCKLVYQLPVRKGLKMELVKYVQKIH